MSRRFRDNFTVYRKTATTGTTGEVTYTEAAVVTDGLGLCFNKGEAFGWRDDRGRVTGTWRLITDCANDIQENDRVLVGTRYFTVISVEDNDLRFQTVVLDAL